MNILNKIFGKIYVISSFSTSNRIDIQKKFFEQENINFELIIAPKKKYFKPDYNVTTVTEGAQSLICANESIFLKELYYKSDTFCVLEDDIIFNQNYKEKLQIFYDSLPIDWSILNLGYHKNTPINSKINNHRIYYKLEKLEEIVGTHIIVYKREVVDFLLNTIENCIYPMDWFLTKNIYPHFNTYTCVEKMFLAGSYRINDGTEYEIFKSGIC